MYSTNGSTWTIKNVPDGQWRGITYDGSGIWVAVGATGTNKIITATDPTLTWTAVTPFPDRQWQHVTYGAGTFVAVATLPDLNTDKVMTSSDNGSTWVVQNTTTANNWYAVIYGADVFCAVSIDGDGNRYARGQATHGWVSSLLLIIHSLRYTHTHIHTTQSHEQFRWGYLDSTDNPDP